MPPDETVVVLGGGINGAAIARELLLNHIPVWLVDNGDLSFGATAYSSRLIHGGLRYLEYRDVPLVEESLSERSRLLQLAQRHVKPLRLYIPTRDRWTGFWQAARRFITGKSASGPAVARGYYIVRAGLKLYDLLRREKDLPRSRSHRNGEPGTPQFSDSYRWSLSYGDAQIIFPERFVISLLRDAQQIATKNEIDFRVFTHAQFHLAGNELCVEDETQTNRTIPTLLINATGAWVDHTWQQLTGKQQSPPLMGGTKGTHLYTFDPDLLERMNGSGVYAEAEDGRPIFVLPLLKGALIGTTDLHHQGDPGTARGSSEEIEYLLRATNRIFADLNLKQDDIHLNYCGVRPLPYVGTDAGPAATTRGHKLESFEELPFPALSVIGGKLTTCRALAEDVAVQVCNELGKAIEIRSQDRPIEEISLHNDFESLLEDESRIDGYPFDVLWHSYLLIGADLSVALEEDGLDWNVLTGTSIPRWVVWQVLEKEWCDRLLDLATRRLMLPLFGCTIQTIRELAGMLVEKNLLNPDQVDATVKGVQDDWSDRFSLQLSEE